VKALVLAAGDGARLEPITQHLPIAMLPIGSETVVSRLFRQLAGCGVAEVCVVVGYQGERLQEHLSEVAERLGIELSVLSNGSYARTSTAFSASLASRWVGSTPFLLIDGDVVTTDEVVTRMAQRTCSTIAYERRPITGPEEMKLAIRNRGWTETVARLGKNLANETVAGECIGIAAFDGTGAESLFSALGELEPSELESSYYERAINDVAARIDVATLQIDHTDWTEIDFVTDYLEAAAKFGGAGSTRVAAISEQILLCPGPVRVSPAVRRALMHEDIGHRESEFVEILTRTRQKLSQVFGVGTHSGYTNVILTGSGTAANEAVVSSYLCGKRTLVLANGEFGCRLVDLCLCHGVDVTALDFGWTRPYRTDRIEAALRSGDYDAVFMVHHETSTGMLNPVREVGSLCTQYGVALCVDAVSSIGAEQLDIEEANIAFSTGCSNKAIASLPGLSFVCGKKEEFASLAGRPSRSRYLDLFRHFEFEERRYQTPNTPAVSLFFALEAALDELLTETVEGRMRHYDQLSSIVRTELFATGWEPVIPPSAMSRTLTTFYYPDAIDVEGFHQWIRQHNFVIYRGKGPLEGKAFQVANIGWLDSSDMERFVNVVKNFDLMPRPYLQLEHRPQCV
jgi:2-aminoethylphosphonate-pyruvate transaminase